MGKLGFFSRIFKAISLAFKTFSTGGQKETWEKIEKVHEEIEKDFKNKENKK